MAIAVQAFLCSQFGPCNRIASPRAHYVATLRLHEALLEQIESHPWDDSIHAAGFNFYFLADTGAVSKILDKNWPHTLSRHTEWFRDSATYTLSTGNCWYKEVTDAKTGDVKKSLKVKVKQTSVLSDAPSEHDCSFLAFQEYTDDENILYQLSKALDMAFVSENDLEKKLQTIAKYCVVRKSWVLPVQDGLAIELQLDSAMLAPQKYYEVGTLRVRHANDSNPLSKADLTACATRFSHHLLSNIDIVCATADSKLAVCLSLAFFPQNSLLGLSSSLPLQQLPKLRRSSALYSEYALSLVSSPIDDDEDDQASSSATTTLSWAQIVARSNSGTYSSC